MQVNPTGTKLVSLLLVFLSENYDHKFGSCDACGTSLPQFGKTFFIGQKWVCIECVMKRINGWD